MSDFVKKLGPLSNVEYLKLFIGQIFSYFGDAIIQIALIAWIISFMPVAGSAVTKVLFCFLLPQFLLSPFAGICTDKFSRKKILIFSTIYRAILLLTIACIIKITGFTVLSTAQIWVIYIFSFLLGVGSAFFYPAKMASAAVILKSGDLKVANALSIGSGVFSVLLSAVLSGAYIAKIGFFGSFLINGVLYSISAIVLSSLVFKKPQHYPDNKTGIIGGLKFAQNYIKTHKKAFYLITLSIVLSLVIATFLNTLNVFIADYYKFGIEELTKLKDILGIGMIFVTIITIYLARFTKIPHLFAIGFFVFFTATLTALFCPTIEQAWFWMIAIGAASAIILVVINTILQKITPGRILGRIFALQSTLGAFSFLAGTIVIALIIDKTNPLLIFKIIALLCLVMTLIVLTFDKSFIYFILRATLGHAFLLLSKYTVEGIEYLPKKGKVILAGNHTGNLDPFIIQMATQRHIWFLTGPGAFQVPFWRRLLKYFNVIPIVPKKGLEAIDVSVKKLEQGEAVLIFPEGKFTPTGILGKFNRGVAIMAKHADAPIIPFAIQGGFEAWGKYRTFPKLFSKITIQFGQAIDNLDADEKEIVKELHERVQFMKNALERKALYHINDKFCDDNFLELLQIKSDIYGPTKALSINDSKSEHQVMSYIELSRLAKNFANYLIEEIKIERNDRIAILSESHPEWGVAMFASIQTGAITVPLDVKLTLSELTSILSDCNPRVICVSNLYLDMAVQVKENVKSIEHIFIMNSEHSGKKNFSHLQRATNINDEKPENSDIKTIFEIETNSSEGLARARNLDETALIVYTSGTTGNPKGVMISFSNVYSQLRDFENLFKINEKNTFVSILPLNHLLELNVGFFGTLYMGAKVVYAKSLSPKEISNVMRETGATNMLVVPLFVKILKNSVEKEVNKKPKSVRVVFNLMFKIAKFMPKFVRRVMFKSVIKGFGGHLDFFVCGGAPLELKTGEFFERIGIPIYQGYGLTETSPIITTNYPKNNKLGSVGKPLPSVRIKIGDNGEILASGKNLMQGYYNNPEMTAEVIDKEGWLHTGDIGEIDKQGYLYITGRIKSMIVLSSGKKVFPEEVEAILEHSSLIKELCIIGLKVKSGSKSGTEKVGAVVVPNDELAKKSDEEIQKIIREEFKILGKDLASYKQPTTILIHREELPKTSTRKVKRKPLLEWYEGLNM